MPNTGVNLSRRCNFPKNFPNRKNLSWCVRPLAVHGVDPGTYSPRKFISLNYPGKLRLTSSTAHARKMLVYLFVCLLRANHRAAVESIAKFIGCDLTPSEISSIVEQTSFDTMKATPAASKDWQESLRLKDNTPFLRKGKVGDWKNHFTDEQSARMDQEIKKKLEGTGFEYTFS